MLTLQLLFIVLLIIVNGFFAMAEIALVASRKARLQPLAEAGNPGAQAALELKADPSRLLSTVQIGVTVIAILTGTFGEATLGEALERQLESYEGLAARYAHVVSMAVVVIAISYFSLILGELVPKRIALAHTETHCRGARSDHAGNGSGGSADRMVLERLDQPRASPSADA